MNVKNKEGKEGVWVYVHCKLRLRYGRGADNVRIDLKNEGKVSKGAAKKAGRFSLYFEIAKGGWSDDKMLP